MNGLKKLWICFVNRLLPVRKKTILFYSFSGQFNDNPKAIFEKLYQREPKLNIVWVTSSKTIETFPSYVQTVENESKDYYRNLMRAQIVVDNYVGLRLSTENGFLERFRRRIFVKKRKSQLCISTWHGTPLKRIGIDALSGSERKACYYTCSDYIVAGCNLTKNALESAYYHSVPVKMYGTPRNDILLDKTVDVTRVKEKLGVAKNYKVVLFAPTFRNSVEYSGVKQMSEWDFEKLFSALQKRFGGEWCFVFRVHHMVLKAIDVEGIAAKYGGRILNGNLHDDMAEYLLCADVLISDYSGSIFDYALTGKPCFLLAPDREHYEKSERGFYLDYDKLPFPMAANSEELNDKIAVFDGQKYKEGVKTFLSEIGNVEDGRAAERIVDDVLDFIQKRKTKKEVINT